MVAAALEVLAVAGGLEAVEDAPPGDELVVADVTELPADVEVAALADVDVEVADPLGARAEKAVQFQSPPWKRM